MKFFRVNLLAAIGFITAAALAAEAQNKFAPLDSPNLDERITEDTDFKYSFLLVEVFPKIKLKFDNPQDNTASRSIPLRKLFGKGFSRLTEQSRVSIRQTRWVETKNKQRYLIVLFAAERSPDDKNPFYLLAAFRYVWRKIPDGNVFNALHYRWTYEFDLADAIDPRDGADFAVELPKDIPAVKNARGEETFWLLNSQADDGKGKSTKKFNAVTLENNRLNALFVNFPLILGNNDCRYRSEGNFLILPSYYYPKSPFGELDMRLMIWSKNSCDVPPQEQALAKPDLREVRRFSARWQTLPDKRRVIRIVFYESHYEILSVAPAETNR